MEKAVTIGSLIAFLALILSLLQYLIAQNKSYEKDKFLAISRIAGNEQKIQLLRKDIQLFATNTRERLERLEDNNLSKK